MVAMVTDNKDASGNMCISGGVWVEEFYVGGWVKGPKEGR